MALKDLERLEKRLLKVNSDSEWVTKSSKIIDTFRRSLFAQDSAEQREACAQVRYALSLSDSQLYFHFK